MNSYHDLLFWLIEFMYNMKLYNIWIDILDEFFNRGFLQSFHLYVVTSLCSIKLNLLTQPQILKSRHVDIEVCMILILIVVEATNKQWMVIGQNGSFAPFCTWDGKFGGWQNDESTLLLYASLHCSYPHNFDVKK